MRKMFILLIGTLFISCATVKQQYDFKSQPEYITNKEESIWIVFSETPNKNGIDFGKNSDEGKFKLVDIPNIGKSWVTEGINPYNDQGYTQNYFRITDDNFKGGKTKSVTVSFYCFDTYFQYNGPHVPIVFEYDSSDNTVTKTIDNGAFKDLPDIYYLTNRESNYLFQYTINDAFFNNRCNGYDFRIILPKDFHIILKSVSVERAN
jgi:hypothetical protein